MYALDTTSASCLGDRRETAKTAFLSKERSFFGHNNPSQDSVKDVSTNFHDVRQQAIGRFLTAHNAWNGSVADLVDQLGNELTPYSVRKKGVEWQGLASKALRDLPVPLHSDVILTTKAPLLKNEVLRGAVRVFCSSILEQDLEFMPKPMVYPKFPYFAVEPATQNSLFAAGLLLLANPPGIAEDEENLEGTSINTRVYTQRPMVSVELDLKQLEVGTDAAVLLNWSCRGRMGAHAKVFIDGELDLPAFAVTSTDDDAVPNFWTIIPWPAKASKVVVDLKHVGSGYMWFEHVDVHHVRWINQP